ncbi:MULTISPECIES: iron-containing alcohol dehydrogenase [unclassified Candidatus Frackibacter]|uniref:iron-containing alcohol dehydrogenase n=1 Tax=unclassified Candidatus Frackibacter TaxID=2648818 RepID=UPI00088240AD|nr:MULTISPECIES: iron-containing alcohol dehydrogenase [unclassified Candidatus Frackibacter]SDC78648.1 alcohol dehydrogenase [Candidatus Frackibacter sp. WG11]SEM91463.1 alcohol dehydrogenase [Candidatus Frackibacter sp. WG12]SFM01254.1 alcohol dehydrogenase [Candidatus Frackibacter sp. WG13]
MKKTYGYFMPPVNLMGAGSVEEIGDQIKKLKGTKALIVTDEVLVEIGIVEQVTDQIEEAGVETVVFDGVQPNPTVGNVEAGLDLLEAEDCDVVVSVGGGSPHDCAKGIALVATNGGVINDYEGVDQSTKPMMPLIAVNTTAGTASEMTRFCIITDEERHIKMAIVDWRVTPNVAINDPLLMMKKPPALTAATGMDALTHAVEAYVSTEATPVTDSAALMAIELIAKNLRNAVANGDNFEARDNMAYAEFLAGMAFNNASLGYVHAMAHQLGGYYDLPHGVCNAILLPHVERFNLIANPQRLADIAEAMGENIDGLSVREAADKALDAIVTLSEDIGIPQSLSDLEGTEVKKEDFEVLAENAMKDACSLTNPRTATKEEVIGIFDAAF